MTTGSTSTYRRKLIEVDLPLDIINAESAREKSIRHGHPSTLHLWWARRPLAACRAVIFASLVDDPADCPDEFPTEGKQRAERQRLHDLIKRMVKWENSNDANLLADARYEIARSVARSNGETAPAEQSAVLDYLNRQAKPIYDPFCGGGSIPLEAQRLGLRAVGSDLNPVAVLITKALIELPPKFANRPPVNPDAPPMGLTVGKGKQAKQVSWRGAAGLADDVRYYGRKMREMAWERIGHLYPKAQLPDGGEATVIAWLWARTVPCPNPACGVAMPLTRNWQLSTKKKNVHWIKPVVDHSTKSVSFSVQSHKDGVPKSGTVNRNGATCVACDGAVNLEYVRQQARDGKMGEVMTCVVAKGERNRVFLPPTSGIKKIASSAAPPWRPPATYAHDRLQGKRSWVRDYPLAPVVHRTPTNSFDGIRRTAPRSERTCGARWGHRGVRQHSRYISGPSSEQTGRLQQQLLNLPAAARKREKRFRAAGNPNGFGTLPKEIRSPTQQGHGALSWTRR